MFTFAKLWIHSAHLEIRQSEASLSPSDRHLNTAPTKIHRYPPQTPFTTFDARAVFNLYLLLASRQGELVAARKLLGNAIGRCPKDKLFKEYVQLELQLGEVPRVSLREEGLAAGGREVPSGRQGEGSWLLAFSGKE